MSRRHAAKKREVLHDVRFGSVDLTKFMNAVIDEGKKTVAEKIVYGALEIVQSKAKMDPDVAFNEAMKSVMPSIEVRSRRVGGATYQVPV